MNLRNYKTVKERREALGKKLSIHLSHIGYFSLDEKRTSSRNCENMIGVTQIPMGIAGPLKIKEFGEFFVPLATTEGALVASVNRGCKAITLSGGASVITQKIGITRAPVFAVSDFATGKKFTTWVGKNFSQLKKIAESTSNHLTLLEIEPWLLGRNVFLRFLFDSQDAMGMNMVTIATDKTIPYIESKTPARCIALSGNMDVDKKPNFLNFIQGRGYVVSAEAIISEKTLRSVLKTTARKIQEVVQRKILYGSIMSGTIGANAHYASMLAALFLATGQDVAHVSESSIGVTTAEIHGKNNLYISVYLPDCIVGAVGGGTGLSTQKEALSILGIVAGNKGKSAEKLATIIAAGVLAGELSLLASLAEGSLAIAHKKLARG